MTVDEMGYTLTQYEYIFSNTLELYSHCFVGDSVCCRTTLTQTLSRCPGTALYMLLIHTLFLRLNVLFFEYIIQKALWWLCDLTLLSLFGLRIIILMYFTIGVCFDLTHKKEHSTLICTPMGWNWRERNSLTKENICIKWKADEKICNYVPDWVKYFSASTCQLPLEPVPNGWLPVPGRGPRKRHIRTVPSPATSPFPQIHGQCGPLISPFLFTPLSPSLRPR